MPTRSSPEPDAKDVWQVRTDLVKKELAAQSAANDAKTARLKALRLARDAQDEQPAARAPRANGKTRGRKI